MSGHIGLREEARAGQLLARRIAGLFRRWQMQQQACQEGYTEVRQKACLSGEAIS
ncbi:hypothetical protein SAMN03159511_3639 [Pseudomonas sp. NFACC19-2]|uniref:Uncharacterized protein n=1 Tax=Ectopseudomonas toyotomiensis TaxID=554344 RepID=A0AA42IT82_9GAMM|nr:MULTISPECIES: hypothetical protein [Pseudomonas]MBG0841663.1 hypothetical protein [Pseudomonas toyotomiensis]MDH0702831.1 hypothetical protein [Pseudomonas toyotomiensis]SFW47439.1 hypothetical protein SAMN03159511_3639 [Pseudomonas sp. NFACC19-2]